VEAHIRANACFACEQGRRLMHERPARVNLVYKTGTQL
jgi:hypothetical protein